jgi:hypothetical protein
MNLIALIIILLFSSLAKAEAEIPKVWNIDFSNDYYIVREQPLKELHNLLEKNNSLIAIVGSSGVGKTQLARKYAYKYRKDYDIVWWLDSEQNLDEQFLILAKELNKVNNQYLHINLNLKNEELTNQVKEHLRNTKLRWLIIFDNASDNQQIEQYLPQSHNSYIHNNIIITSKNPLVWTNHLRLERFSRQESIELIQKINPEINTENSNLLAEALKDYPIAVKQAALYLKQHPSISIKEYQQLLQNKRKELLQANPKKLHKTTFAAISMSINNLRKESPEAFELLVLCSLIHSKNIPSSLLKQYSSQHLKLNELDQEKAISDITKYSLILRDIIQKEHKSYYQNAALAEDLETSFTIHEIVQLIVQEILTKKEKQFLLTKALISMTSFLPWNPELLVLTKAKIHFIWPHVNSLISYSIKERIYSDHLLSIMVKQLEYFILGIRNFEISAIALEQIKNTISQTNSINYLTLAKFHRISSNYHAWHDSDYRKAIAETNISYDLLKKVKTFHPTIELSIISRYIQYYNHLGKNKKALEYEKIGEKLIKSVRDNLNKYTFYLSLAEVYFDAGNFKKALDYISKAKTYSSIDMNSAIPRYFPLYFQEIEILIRTQEYEKAHNVANQLKKLSEDFFEDQENELVAYITIFRAFTSHKVHKTDEKNNLISGQNMLLRFYKNNSKMRKMYALSHIFQGNIFSDEGRYLEAIEKYTQAEEFYNNIRYGATDASIDTISLLYTKLACNYSSLKDNKMAQYYLDMHRKYFGYNHYRNEQIAECMIRNKMAIVF